MVNSENQMPVGGIFAAILKAERARFNAKFNVAKRNAPALDGAAFGAHLRLRVAPLVEAIHEFNSTRASGCADELYDLSLALFVRNILGENVRVPVILRAWHELFPLLIPLLANAPKRIGGQVCNALVALHETPGAREGQWLAEMKNIAAGFVLQGNDGDDFLLAGQVVAWRCGLAQFRVGALLAAQKLTERNESLARAALGIEDTSTPVAQEIAEAIANPWWTPHETAGALQIKKAVGAFHGFTGDKKIGAVFVSPPRVVFHDGNFFAADTQNCWQIFADSFGANFHRAGSAQALPPGENTPNEILETQFHELKNASSAASDGETLVLTLPHSHALFFVAL